MYRFLRILVLCLLPLAASGQTPTVLVLGDSLSAAYGIPQVAGWVSLLQAKLAREGYPHRVVNKSISGETTAGGLRRLPAALDEHAPAVVLIQLGANDGLRGQSLTAMQDNLRALVEQSQAAGARVALFEIRIPSNYGSRYTQDFRQRFTDVAEATGAKLVPFFLAPIATDPEAFQDDGIHPAAVAQPQMLDAVWPHIRPLLEAESGS